MPNTPDSLYLSKVVSGYANILSTKGDLIGSDGIQAMRVPVGVDGLVLTADSTLDAGFGWKVGGGGGGSLTFSDGVTLASTNVTNDLVTGATVAHINAITSGAAIMHSTGAMTLQTDGASDLNVNPSHDEIHTVGRNLSMTAAGSNGVFINATHAAGEVFIQSDNDDIQLVAGGANPEGDGTGHVKLFGEDIITGKVVTFNGENSYIAADGTVGDLIISGGAGETQTTITILGTEGSLLLDCPGTSGGKLRLQSTGGQAVGAQVIALHDGTGTKQWAAIADADAGTIVAKFNTLLANLRLRGDLDI